MVSLVNFKIFNEELQQHQPKRQDAQPQHQHQHGDIRRESHAERHCDAPVSIIHVMHAPHDHHAAATQLTTVQVDHTTPSHTGSSEHQLRGPQAPRAPLAAGQPTLQASSESQHPVRASDTAAGEATRAAPGAMLLQPATNKPSSQLLFELTNDAFAPAPHADGPNANELSNFAVTWRNLRFAIEPKWHQKLSSAAALAGRLAPANINRLAQSPGPTQPGNRVVLDRLDGSFRSGELTAILGPSGAGKTTLLDCLTGHRKHGLSGSIRISTSSSPINLNMAHLSGHSHNLHHSHHSHHHHHHHRHHHTHTHHHNLGRYALTEYGSQQEPNKTNLNLVGQYNHSSASLVPEAANTTNRDNLKVSIIPQNDHLIGHLTVYETLSYASKMKNCFDKQFNHKFNIKRVAQQLGLMSCLSTRINKLSGGQYKRVSIAQELLSSPDILILDEPTSGLDAMTCYQTVQVLRKLTDDRQANGLKQIAVILTIHQPNSDVFQQFNHVYVVAQGGKCIYEGPPANIESVINRVGIRLPNSHYNPATMIVEIAAGKFGQDAIHKLNSIQKKQYDFVVPDEQNSTGDSAVDCPSSSSNEEDDDDDIAKRGAHAGGRQRNLKGDIKSVDDAGGLVNKGFEMENESDTNNDGNNNTDNNYNINSGNSNNNAVIDDHHSNDDNNNNTRDVIVVVPKVEVGEADLVDKIKTNNNNENNSDIEGRRKKRRRTRKRASEPGSGNAPSDDGTLKAISAGDGGSGSAGGGGAGGGGAGGAGNDTTKREKRVKLNSLKADQKFPFWRHTYLHFHRSWLSIVRDPMLCSMQLALHIIVPLMVSLVYGTNVGKPNACPRAGPVDIMAYALEPTDLALQLQEDLRTTLENIGYIFFKLYGIIFAAMTVTVLTFPLDMHVLVKEFRNGWYGLSSYFLGRTLADIPFQLTLPLLAMSLSYYATGQPYSYMQWRFLSTTAILILSSLIAQSQGLLFGAILMDKMKAAVFVAPAATTPIILFAGFLVRTQSIPRYLRPLSNLSYLRYAIEACLISRYGFNQCECDPSVFNQTVPELPPIARSMLDYWLSSFKPPASDNHDTAMNSTAIDTTTTAMPTESPDLFTKLIDSLARANSFGRNITSCEQVVPYPMIDYDLKDSQLISCFAILILMLVFTRLLTFFIVCVKVKRKV